MGFKERLVTIDSGFDKLQTNVNVPVDQLKEARERRDLFRTELVKEPDIVEVRPSGSLARGTHKNPINDVDLVVVVKATAHPDWGLPGPSALAALEHASGIVTARLGSSGTGDVRLVRLRNHSIKCFLDDPEDPEAFTVDVSPALIRDEGGILIPEKESEDWIPSDPQHLIDLVATRHDEWNEFARLVRVLKRWNTDHGAHMKSLTVEVLALDHLPVGSRQGALKSFFAAAQEAVWYPIEDPAHLSGPIQRDLDMQAASDALSAAADIALRAVEAEANDETREAQCLWNKLFGDIYPEPYGGCGSGSAATVAVVPKRRVVDSTQG